MHFARDREFFIEGRSVLDQVCCMIITTPTAINRSRCITT